jgi:hypothetical protein
VKYLSSAVEGFIYLLVCSNDTWLRSQWKLSDLKSWFSHGTSRHTTTLSDIISIDCVYTINVLISSTAPVILSTRATLPNSNSTLNHLINGRAKPIETYNLYKRHEYNR